MGLHTEAAVVLAETHSCVEAICYAQGGLFNVKLAADDWSIVVFVDRLVAVIRHTALPEEIRQVHSEVPTVDVVVERCIMQAHLRVFRQLELVPGRYIASHGLYGNSVEQHRNRAILIYHY